MKKSKILLIAGGGIALILLIASAVIAFMALSSASQEKEEMNKSFTELTSFYRKNPFPNKDNIAVEKSNLEVMKNWKEQYTNAFNRAIIKKEFSISPGNFTMVREHTIDALIKNAPKVGEGGTVAVVDSGFDFSFGRYTTGVPANKSDVPRLMRQLKMIEFLMTNVLYVSSVHKVETVKREEFESGGGQPQSGFSGAIVGGRNRGSQQGSVEFDFSPLPAGAVAIDRERFGLVFTATQSALFSVLNKIDSLWPFMMISSLEFSKVSGDVVFPAEAKPEQLTETLVANPKPLGRTARTVSGKNREAPLRVIMTVDFLMLNSDQNSGSNAN